MRNDLDNIDAVAVILKRRQGCGRHHVHWWNRRPTALLLREGVITDDDAERSRQDRCCGGNPETPTGMRKTSCALVEPAPNGSSASRGRHNRRRCGTTST